MDILLNFSQFVDLLSTSIRLSTPLIYAAIGGLIAERAGIYNISLEGCILMGCFAAAAGSILTGIPLVGLIFAMILSSGVGLLLSVLGITIGVNQIVAGIAINTLVLGLTSFGARMFFDDLSSITLAGFNNLPIPLLSEIPVVGKVLFQQDILVYLMFVLIPTCWYILFKTTWGLNLRSIGEFPKAADVAGINVNKVRYLAVIFSCMIAGLGGAFIVLSQVFIFTEHMSSGKGFIAIAALILGRWHPIGACMAALLFGFCDALQLRMQFFSPDVPYQLFTMIPYVGSILALVLLSGRVKPPSAIGELYVRDGK